MGESGDTDEPQQPSEPEHPLTPSQAEASQPTEPAEYSETGPLDSTAPQASPHATPHPERSYPTSYRSRTTRHLQATRPGTQPPSAERRWREDTNSYRLLYRETTGIDLPKVAVPLPPPPRRSLALVLLAVMAGVFGVFVLVCLFVLLPGGTSPNTATGSRTGTTATSTPQPTGQPANTSAGVVIPNVTFTTQTPDIVEPIGGEQGQPFLTPTVAANPTATIDPNATLTPTGGGNNGNGNGNGNGN